MYSFEGLGLLLLAMGVECRRGKQDVVIQSQFIPRDTEYCRRAVSIVYKLLTVTESLQESIGCPAEGYQGTGSLLPVVTRVGASSLTLCSECFLGLCWLSGASAPQGIYLLLKSNCVQECGTF